MAEQQWTAEQLDAIRATGEGLLVSAAAGSGKTSVLASRCVYLVCDAPEPCEVTELLVVTFTEAAAAEMKSRIERSLRQRLAEAPTPRLRRQVALVDHAAISTVHGFCMRLLRQNFHRIGLDPAFSVLDPEEGLLLRQEIVSGLFHEHYEGQSDDFRRFVDEYGPKGDELLMQLVIDLHNVTGSLADPAGWAGLALQRLAEGADKPLTDSRLGQALMDLLASRLGGILADCEAATRGLGSADFKKYFDYVVNLGQAVEGWIGTLRNRGYAGLVAEVKGFAMPRLPSIRGEVPGKEAAKALVEQAREGLDKKGPLVRMLRFTEAEWQQGLRAIAPLAKVLLGLVEQFAAQYAKEKARMRCVDFSDLERMALQLLREDGKPGLHPSSVASACHRQFRHVLVDEYQDINEVQDAILHLASTECLASAGRPSNLFCVGDVKQSIYRFRLAEPSRFLDRQRRLGAGEGGRLIALQANFRSRAPLLDGINEVFARLMVGQGTEIDYDTGHRLAPGATYPPGEADHFAGSPIELHLLPDRPEDEAGGGDVPEGEGNGDAGEPRADEPDDEELEVDRVRREATVIASLIRQFMGRDGGQRRSVMARGEGGLRPRPIEWRDMVILLRTVRVQAESYAEILREYGIPVHYAGGSGYFQAMEVQDVLSLLRLLDNQRQDIPLAALLRSPLANLPCPEDCLARIRLAYREGRERVPFHEAVARYAVQQDDELAARLREVLADLERWRTAAYRRPVAELIWSIYQETGYLAFCSGLVNGSQRCANLMSLYDRARQFGGFSRQGIGRFIQCLENLSRETELGQAPEAGEAEDVVRVMSVHKSKGLEFPVVFVPELGKKINFQGCSGDIIADRQEGIGLSVVDPQRMVRYPSLAQMIVQQRLREQTLAEELRVLYVAMTRAREHLVLLGTCTDKHEEKWRQRWGDYAGRLPAEFVLSASKMLDWVGPVATCVQSASAPPLRIERHGLGELKAMQAKMAQQSSPPTMRRELVELQPLASAPARAPAPHPDAQAVIERLSYKYGFEPLSGMAAAISVTTLTKHGATAAAGNGKGGNPTQQVLPMPRFLTEKALTPTDRGTAVHAVLEHLDFRAAADRAAVEAQVQAMLERRFITAAQAEAVDYEAIDWLLGSELGRLMSGDGVRLRRELAFNYAVPNDHEDPMDQQMVRGRIDVLIERGQEMILADYKTDHVEGERLKLRVELYRPQLLLYAEALEAITGRRVVGCWLAFLHPRQLVNCQKEAK